MTGQDLLNRMELINAELQLQPGEENVTKGLLALNVAQDYFESLAALRSGIFGSHTGTVTTSANTESTAFPSGLLRVDRLQFLDATTSRPKRDMHPIRRTGGHRSILDWPYLTITSTGEPTHYWTNGRSIYWRPLPNGTHTIRWYGFQAAADITAAGTFQYDDIVAMPIAAFAVRLIKSGLDDPAEDQMQIAQSLFATTIDTLSLADRDGARGLAYSEVHTT